MGCDIHAILEIKKNKAWVLAQPLEKNNSYVPEGPPMIPVEFDFGRPYDLFARMANVRNDKDRPTQFPPRGLPANASAEVKAWAAWFGKLGHTHSWLLLSEFRELGDWFGDFDIYEDLDSVRLVFWFDS